MGLALLIVAIGAPLAAQERSPNFDLEADIVLPRNYDPEREYPAIAFLQATFGTSGLAANQYTIMSGVQEDFVLILPKGTYTREDYDGQFGHFISWYEERLLKDIERAHEKASIDEDRIYMAGFSLGGDLAWALSIRNPDVFAGAAMTGTRASYHTNSEALETLNQRGYRAAFMIGDEELEARAVGIAHANDHLEAAGIETMFREFPGGHVVQSEELGIEALNFITDGLLGGDGSLEIAEGEAKPISEVLEVLNLARGEGRQCDDRYMASVDPVEWNEDRAEAAVNHVRLSAHDAPIYETDPEQATAVDRYFAVSEIRRPVDQRTARGGVDPQRTVDAFLNHADACQVLMSAELEEIGAARGGGDRPMWSLKSLSEEDPESGMESRPITSVPDDLTPSDEVDSEADSEAPDDGSDDDYDWLPEVTEEDHRRARQAEVSESRVLLDMINSVRTQGHQCPGGEEMEPARSIDWSDDLAETVSWYVRDMLRRDTMMDNDSTNRLSRDRIPETVEDAVNVYNIRVRDQGTPGQVLGRMLRNKTWCQRLLGPHYNSAAVAVANDGEAWAIDMAYVPNWVPVDEDTGEQEQADDDEIRSYPEVLQLVNEVRSEGRYCGDDYMPAVGPLSWHDYLAEAAGVHTRDMEAHDNLSHTGSDGSDPSDRFSRVMGTRVFAGENVSVGYAGVEQAIQGWVDSPGHCKNMMRPHHRYLGVSGTEETRWWTMKLAGSGTPQSPESGGQQQASLPPSSASGDDDADMPNWRAEASQQSLSLHEDFEPDPLQIPDVHSDEPRMVANEKNSQQIPIEGCEGYIRMDAPEVKLDYTAERFPLTIWSFDPQLGTSLLVRSPDGQWHCATGEAEDSAGAIRFQSPQSGTYSIWVGSTQGGSHRTPSDVRINFSALNDPQIRFDVGTIEVVE